MNLMKTEISKVLKIHMRFFNAIGFCCLSFDGNFKRNATKERYLTLWTCFLMLMFNVVAFMALLSNEAFLFTDDSFGYFNDILKVVFANIAVTVTYMESLLKRSELFKFWKKYNFLQNNLQHLEEKCICLDDIREHRRFLLIFYTVAVLESVMMLCFLVFQKMTRHLVMFWSVFTPFIFAVHMRNMQFVFYIELIRLELIKLKQDLEVLVDYSRFAAYGCAFEGFENFLRQKVAEKQRHYQLIYEMFEHFHNAFGFSIVAVLLMIYVRVLVDSYFGYYTFYRGPNKIEPYLLIPAFFQIPICLITSKNCMDVVKLITFNLHCIISQFSNQGHLISTQLQNFSLQILHQKICINGIGITRMDGYMLTRAIGSITTYMIFFIQFMPKFTTNLQDDKKQ